MGMQQRDNDSDSDSDNLVKRHIRTSTKLVVVMMTSQYCLGKCCDIEWAKAASVYWLQDVSRTQTEYWGIS